MKVLYMRSGQRSVLIVLLIFTSAVGFASITPSSVSAEPAKYAVQGQVTVTHRLPGGLYAALVQVNPYVQQAELTAGDGGQQDTFGSSVALSSDGRTALVGASSKSGQQGTAYVFTDSGGTWIQQAELTASDGASADHFGCSVALSSDGRTALIGALDKTVNGQHGKGAVYVFTGDGAWTQQTELTASKGAIAS